MFGCSGEAGSLGFPGFSPVKHYFVISVATITTIIASLTTILAIALIPATKTEN